MAHILAMVLVSIAMVRVFTNHSTAKQLQAMVLVIVFRWKWIKTDIGRLNWFVKTRTRRIV